MNNNLHSIYQNLLHDYEQKLKKSKYSARLISILRLTVFIAGITLIYFFANAGSTVYLTLDIVLTIVFFLVLVKTHSLFLNKQKEEEAYIKINKDEITALSGDFSHFENGKAFLDSKHSYSFDIDIFGDGSLFQFLNRTSTFIGRIKLVDRLRFPFLQKEKIIKYQEAVAELKDKLSWRQKFQTIGISHKEKDSDKVRILQWIKRPALFQNPIFVLMVVSVPLLSIAMVVLYSMDFIGEKQLLFYFLVPLGISGSYSMKINRKHQEVSKTSAMLSKYGKLINLIETAEFSSDVLSEFKQTLNKDSSSAASDIKKLSVILGALDSRLNIFAWFFLNGIMLWDILQILRLERWQLKHREKLDKWFDIIAETEVIISLANFYYNNPEAKFPNIEKGEYILKADSLGHPLIKEEERVNNSVEMKSASITIITGANMAGKSTWLRTVGVNLILGMIGAPVSGKGVTIKPIQLFTSIRQDDSLQKNESYFYSELKRLKSIIDELKRGTELFIILDEILRGTNSKDKHSGSEALLKQLIGLGTSGIIATHDVSLGILEKIFPQHIKNRCFEVDIDGNELSFDYKLRDGVSKNMNATILMREMGITV